MIEIPFYPRFHEAIRSGNKTMTSRTKEYGKAGDILRGPGCRLVLISVRYLQLGDIARDYYAQEGCASPNEFRLAWRELHPIRGFDPKEAAYLHEFRVIE
jgi:uncharacterized protein YqfB (UPF0267 family)